MIDQTGDMPWMQPTLAEAAPPAREPRQKRKPRAETVTPKKERKPRASPVIAGAEKVFHEVKRTMRESGAKIVKPRKAKKEKKPELLDATVKATIKVTLKQYAAMTVGPDDAKLFLKLHGMLSLVSKGTRAKVLGELAKVFG